MCLILAFATVAENEQQQSTHTYTPKGQNHSGNVAASIELSHSRPLTVVWRKNSQDARMPQITGPKPLGTAGLESANRRMREKFASYARPRSSAARARASALPSLSTCPPRRLLSGR